MKGAALSDLHLGFRAFPSTTDGRNTREVDVERAWAEAVDQIIEEDRRAPIGIITIAGDVFHHPRVSDYAKKAFLDGIRRLLLHTGAAIIVLQGNHDAGRTVEVLTPIMLAEGSNRDRLWIVTEPERIRFGTLGQEVSVACFPFVARGDGAAYRLDPDPDADLNILVIHAAVRGDREGDALPYFYGGDTALDVGREADRWDVIHCGDFHEFRRLHPTRLAFYSGSLERTSSNIWQEHDAKGWVLWDSDDETMDLRPVHNRPMRDYAYGDLVKNGLPVGAMGLNGSLHLLVAAGPEDENVPEIVRLKVDDFPHEEREHIDWALVRRLKSECCHFYLDLRYARAEVSDMGDRRERRALSLAEEAAAFFADDPDDVRELAISYLDVEAEAEDLEEEASHA